MQLIVISLHSNQNSLPMKNSTYTARTYITLIIAVIFSLNAFSQITIYSESFQNNNGGWSFTSPGSANTSWLRSTIQLDNYIFSQRHGWNYYYPNNTRIIATSPTIDLNGYSNIVLDLDIRFETETSYDGMQIEYSLNDGTSWSTLGSTANTNWYNGNVSALGSDG